MLKDVIDKGVQDRHRLVGDTGIRSRISVGEYCDTGKMSLLFIEISSNFITHDDGIKTQSSHCSPSLMVPLIVPI